MVEEGIDGAALSFRINRPGNLREQLRTGLVPHPRGRIGLETAVEHLAQQNEFALWPAGTLGKIVRRC